MMFTLISLAPRARCRHVCWLHFGGGGSAYLQTVLRRWQTNEYTWCVQVLRFPKEAFAAAMQSWRERCEKCVCLQGDYVEK